MVRAVSRRLKQSVVFDVNFIQPRETGDASGSGARRYHDGGLTWNPATGAAGRVKWLCAQRSYDCFRPVSRTWW